MYVIEITSLIPCSRLMSSTPDPFSDGWNTPDPVGVLYLMGARENSEPSRESLTHGRWSDGRTERRLAHAALIGGGSSRQAVWGRPPSNFSPCIWGGKFLDPLLSFSIWRMTNWLHYHTIITYMLSRLQCRVADTCMVVVSTRRSMYVCVCMTSSLYQIQTIELTSQCIQKCKRARA